jgi:WD40 repeat protein
MADTMGPSSRDSTCDEQSRAELKKVTKPCPLCRHDIEVWEQPGLQDVVCAACGLRCTIDASPPPAVEQPVAEPIVETTTAAVHWLERDPRPICCNPQVSLEAIRARKRRKAMLAAVAVLVILSGRFGYLGAKRQFARRWEQQQAHAREVDSHRLAERRRLEQQRQAAKERQATAERELRLVSAKYLAVQAQSTAGAAPWRALDTAINAVNATLIPDDIVLPEAHQSLRDALASCGRSHSLDGIALNRNAGRITSLAVSGDGRWLATGSADCSVRLWDLRSESPRRSTTVLKWHGAPVSHLLFSSDGRWLVSGSRDSSTCLWDLTSSSPTTPPVELPGRDRPIKSIVMSPNGRWLAVVFAGADGEVDSARLWNLAAGAHRASSLELTGHGGRVQAVAISPDSRWLAVGVGETIRLWDLNARLPIIASIARQCHHANLTAALFTNDGKYLITAGYNSVAGRDGAVQLWNLTAQDPSTSTVLSGHRGPIRAVAASADSRWLVAAGEDGTVRAWDLQAADAGVDAIVLKAGKGPLTSAGISADGQWLAAGAETGIVHLWKFSSRGPAEPAIVLESGHSGLFALALTTNTHWLAAGSDRSIRLWNLDVRDLIARASSFSSARKQSLAVRHPWLDPDNTIAGRTFRARFETSKYAVIWQTARVQAEPMPKDAAGVFSVIATKWSDAQARLSASASAQVSPTPQPSASAVPESLPRTAAARVPDLADPPSAGNPIPEPRTAASPSNILRPSLH